MTKKEILEKVIEIIASEEKRFICNAIDLVSNCKNAREIKAHFNNPSNIPYEFRGQKWHGDGVAGIWFYGAKEERITYLKHLISKL